MISTALLFDAVIGNVQEKEIKKHNASNAEVVLYSYGIGTIYILIYLLGSGELFPAFDLCARVSSKLNLFKTRNLKLNLFLIISRIL